MRVGGASFTSLLRVYEREKAVQSMEPIQPKALTAGHLISPGALGRVQGLIR
jgi:hypothetical protein